MRIYPNTKSLDTNVDLKEIETLMLLKCPNYFYKICRMHRPYSCKSVND